MDVVTSATLSLTRFSSNSGNESSETLEFFDVSTDAATLNNNVGTNSTILNDLGTGTSYGRFAVPGSGDSADVLSFTLNASAIGDINAAKGGFFSVGGDLTSQDGNDALLIFCQNGGTQDLVLNVESIPEPSSLAALLGMGIFGLFGYGRRRIKWVF